MILGTLLKEARHPRKHTSSLPCPSLKLSISIKWSLNRQIPSNRQHTWNQNRLFATMYNRRASSTLMTTISIKKHMFKSPTSIICIFRSY